MQLEKIRSMPKMIIDNIEGVDGLSVYLVQDYDNELLRRLVKFGENSFGELGMDQWSLVPQIKHGNVYVLKEANKKSISGIAILMRDWEDSGEVYLSDYAIAEELQGNKLGFHFLNVIIKNIKEQGFKRISLTVDIENKPAINLYEKSGFKIIETSYDEYGKSHDRYIMTLEID